MVKACAFGPCNSKQNPKTKSVNGAPGVFFVKFPSPKNEIEKCRRWVLACGRQNFTVSNVNRSTYVCSKHFHNFAGPTSEYPDPIPLAQVLTPNMINTTTCNSEYDAAANCLQSQSRSGGQIATKQIFFTNQGELLLPEINDSVQRNNNVLNDIDVPRGWSLEVSDGYVTFIKLHNTVKVMQCTFNLDFSSNMSLDDLVKLEVLDQTISYKDIDEAFTLNCKSHISEFLNKLNQFTFCSGNSDKDLLQLYKNSQKLQQNNQLSYYCAKLETIFSTKCSRLISTKNKRCHGCTLYRSNLRKLRYRSKQRACQKKAAKLVKKSKNAMIANAKGKKERDHIEKVLKQRLEKEVPDSLSAIFIQQQLCAMGKSKKGMRWHPKFIKWCCYLKNKSKSTYDALKKSGTVYLPTTRTLYNHNHRHSNQSGFNDEKLLEMSQETDVNNLPECDRYFALLLDEVKVKEDLVCHKNTGYLTGFSSINEEHDALDDMARSIKNITTPPLASHVLQLMLRGITTSFKIPFAHFPTCGANSAALYSIVMEAICRLEAKGFRIIAVIGDGATTNRKFFRMCLEDNENSKNNFYMMNLFATDEERPIYFVSDPPHLIKTVRNCFSNSGCNSKSRLMWKNGEDISWKIIIRLYYMQLRLKGEFKHCPKLTYGHVFLNTYSKMKVSYASQVLSETVACGIETLFPEEKSQYTETLNFIRTFDRFFDLCNVKNCTEGIHKRKISKVPYRHVNDERLLWLEEDFMSYLENWETEVLNRPGKFSKADKSKMLLSKETIEGLKITAKSIPAIVKFLLNKGAKYVLTQHLNQDTLEQEFGRHRAAGGRNSNPSVWLYQCNIDKLKSLSGFVLDAIGGNTMVV